MEITVSWIFVIIFTVIVIGFVLVLGGQQIADLFSIGRTAQLYKEVQNLEALTEELIAFSPGSSKTLHVNAPSGTKLCFLSDNPGEAATYQNPRFNWIPDSITAKVLTTPRTKYYKSALWLYPDPGQAGEGSDIKFLKTERSFCLQSGEELFFENKGDHVLVSCKVCI